MGLAEYEIELDHPEEVFFPGQAVTGQLRIIITNKPKLIVNPGIGVQCIGDVLVNLSRRPIEDNDKCARDGLLLFTDTFMAPPAGGVPLVLPVGDHKFPFSFALPTNIPSSYEGRYGRVQYKIISVISYLTSGLKVCSKFHGGGPCNSNHTSMKFIRDEFCVNSLVDLNTIPQARMSASSTDSKTLGFWCCKSGPITAKTWINQVGYAPGQILYFNAQVENTSQKQMCGSRVQLVEDSIFKCNGATKNVTRVISEKKHGSFNESDDWSIEPFPIPFVAPSTLPDCQIIDVNYRIQLVIDDGGCLAKKHLTLSMPILIGNIPLRTIEAASSDGSVAGPMTPLSLGNDFNNRKLKASSIADYPNLPKPRAEKGHVYPKTGLFDSTSKYVSYVL